MRVLVVDPDDVSREALVRTLTDAGYRDTLVTSDPDSAHWLCVAQRPDVVLIDIDVPGTAPEALEQLRCTPEVAQPPPILALTAGGEREARHRAASLGVHDFIAKPVEETELLLRVRNALDVRRLRHRLEDRNALLAQRAGEHDMARESLAVLAAIADYHDDDTAQHAQRVGIGAALVAEALELEDSFVDLIRDAAPLHDIGKVGISRRILLKPGKLEPAEWMHMMRHVEIGARILAPARSPMLRLAAEIARTHHERWDGNGYLAGLAGEEIPISGRITALVDVWDTLTHERPYKPAWDEERALAEIAAHAGAHFDPRVVHAFLSLDRRALAESVAPDAAGGAPEASAASEDAPAADALT